ncbi:MAG: hypothetical protein A2V88_13640 [Elusimicrobia bacterium RBG_16_66_12]|nr:MAG: hypothetical protein A2V88_13640 [Elusimicrobia bacterium RBG_16_66_12]
MARPLASLGIDLDIYAFLDDSGYSGLYRRGLLLAKVAAMARGAMRRWRDLERACGHDVALVHREIWPIVGEGPMRRLRRFHRRFVVDFDDAVWLQNVSEANRAFVWFKPFDQAVALTRDAATVSAGNPWLAEWARTQRPNRPREDVGVVPTAVDTTRWSPRPRGPGPLRLVWIGSHSTARYLVPWLPAIARLSAQHPDLELHMIGAALEVPGIKIVQREWSYATEVEDVARGDIGLAPLPDTEWARGKCGAKLLLYMALGLPAVASPVGVQAQIVSHGVDGLLAVDANASEAALARLLGDPSLRASLGRAARARVESEYSIMVAAPKLAAILRRAAEGA